MVIFDSSSFSVAVEGENEGRWSYQPHIKWEHIDVSGVLSYPAAHAPARTPHHSSESPQPHRTVIECVPASDSLIFQCRHLHSELTDVHTPRAVGYVIVLRRKGHYQCKKLAMIHDAN